MDEAGPLQEIADQLRAGQQPGKTTVRTLLRWFGAQRRGAFTVRYIQRLLKEAGLTTKPDFRYPWLDAKIEFVLASDGQPSGETSAPTGQDAITITDTTTTVDVIVADPTYRIDRLRSANTPPVPVTPQQTIVEATTIMLMNDFSQLPVMVSEYSVKGMISWSSIGKRLALGIAPEVVQDCMDPAYIVPADRSLLAVIKDVVAHDCVLVQAADNKICGIVTTTDLGSQFGQLAEPFLLLGEIENHIRRIIETGHFTVEELKECRDPNDAKRDILNAFDLTFGEYIRLLQKPDRWSRLALRLDRTTFIKRLEDIRDIRNDVMHFDPDGISEDDLQILRDFTLFLQTVAVALP
jgi:predicted transcriptional regulator